MDYFSFFESLLKVRLKKRERSIHLPEAELVQQNFDGFFSLPRQFDRHPDQGGGKEESGIKRQVGIFRTFTYCLFIPRRGRNKKAGERLWEGRSDPTLANLGKSLFS